MRMSDEIVDPLAYYARQSIISDPEGQAPLFAELPLDVPALCRVVQGLLMHYREGDLYHIEIADARKREVDIRFVAPLLERIHALDAQPLLVARSPENRAVGCCREFALLLCAMLRHHAVPARVRYGFSRYFDPDFACDHVVCEYWHADERRWVLADAQQDDLHRDLNKLTFDPYDLPRDQFLTAGTAWTLCRMGQMDADSFGYAKVPDLRGWLVLRHYLVHELAALNGMELLIWDLWGLAEIEEGDLTEVHMALLDHVAALTEAGNDTFPILRSTYEGNAVLRVPARVTSWSPVTRDRRTVTLAR